VSSQRACGEEVLFSEGLCTFSQRPFCWELRVKKECTVLICRSHSLFENVPRSFFHNRRTRIEALGLGERGNVACDRGGKFIDAHKYT
jgi:hypothetical protein